MKYLFFFIVFVLSFTKIASHPSSYPYLSEDTWTHFCDWRLSSREGFDPKKVQCGDVIVIEDVDCKIFETLRLFETTYLPHIKGPVILITPRSDFSLPGRFDYFLDSEKIAVWFVQNIDRAPSKKLQPVPIGLEGTRWGYDPTMITKRKESRPDPSSKTKWIYVNFTKNRADRNACFAHFASLKKTYIAPRQSKEEYLREVAESVFIVSPQGNGLDCHRTWEALYLGAYPIVKRSTLDPLFVDLPVLIVDRWEEVTEELLEKKRKEFSEKSWELEKLYAPYWFTKIASIQKKLRTSYRSIQVSFCVKSTACMSGLRKRAHWLRFEHVPMK